MKKSWMQKKAEIIRGLVRSVTKAEGGKLSKTRAPKRVKARSERPENSAEIYLPLLQRKLMGSTVNTLKIRKTESRPTALLNCGTLAPRKKPNKSI